MPRTKDIEHRCYPSWLNSFFSFYMRLPSHRGQVRALRSIERIFGLRRWNVKTKYGFRIAANSREASEWTIIKSGVWDDKVARALMDRWSPNDVFFDIGANIGYFTLLGLTQNLRKVVSFEPFRPLAAIATNNLSLNNYSSEEYQLEKLALGSLNGTANYFPGPSSNTGEGTIVQSTSTSDISVPVETLDSYLERTGSPLPTIMKVDVEGSELDVFLGASSLFSSQPPHSIVFEADRFEDYSIIDSRLVDTLESYGYCISSLGPTYNDKKGDYIAALTSRL